MKISFNKSTPIWACEIAKQATQKARDFLSERYSGTDFSELQLKFTTTSSRSRYYIGQRMAVIAITRIKWLYARKRIGIMNPVGIKCGYLVSTTLSIIHEATHHVQNLEARRYSEVETTQNEIEYLRVHHPEHFEKIILVK